MQRRGQQLGRLLGDLGLVLGHRRLPHQDGWLGSALQDGVDRAVSEGGAFPSQLDLPFPSSSSFVAFGRFWGRGGVDRLVFLYLLDSRSDH